MEQHLLAYLTNKYGVRQLITQWLTSILAAVEHFSPLDAQTALFGKVDIFNEAITKTGMHDMCCSDPRQSPRDA